MTKIHPILALQAGWVRYRNGIGPYTAFTLVFIVLSFMLSGIIVGVQGLLMFLSPVLASSIAALLLSIVSGLLTMGFYHFGRMHERGESPEFPDFFRPFSTHLGTTVAVIVITSGITLALQSMMPVSAEELGTSLEGATDLDEMLMVFEDYADVMQEHQASVGAVTVAQILAAFLFFFSVMRASLDGASVKDALAWSIAHAGRNVLRILATMVLAGLISILVTVLTLGLGVLFAVPYIYMVTYDMYAQLTEDEHNDWTLETEAAAENDSSSEDLPSGDQEKLDQ